MKVFAEVLPTTLGRAMYRINLNLRRFAPPDVEFVSNPSIADIQILDSIGKGSLKYLYCPRYILLQYCLLSADDPSPDLWLPVFRDAVFVASYLNLPVILQHNDFNFLRIPLGADPSIFINYKQTRRFPILTTGYVADMETIDKIYLAVQKLNSTIVHVGGDLHLGKHLHRVENISDKDLVHLYNSVHYVSGLRKVEGFELPILEGLLCGARGICYAKEHYQYWFGNLVEYVEEDSPTLVDDLYKILSSHPRPITDEEISRVKSIFNWETIFTTFWNKVKESM